MDDSAKYQPAQERELSLREKIQRIENEVGHIQPDRENTFFNNSPYASLNKIMTTLRPFETKFKITRTQGPTVLDGVFGLQTTLESNGERLSSFYKLEYEKPSPPAVASSLTYARRYSILCMYNLEDKFDDDGVLGTNLSNSDRKAQSQRSPGRSTSPPGGPPTHEDSERAAIQADSGTMDDWGGYVCRFGKKYKGKTLTQIGLENAKSYGNWITSAASQKGESVSGPAAEFIEAVKSWMAQDPAEGVFDG